MKCVKPIVLGKAAFGCGQCLPCRFNRRRTWMHRIMLESLCHQASSFVTLTYSDEVLNLRPVDLKNWLKRLRARIAPQKVRYFACGEYGDVGQRAHFHVALFGFPPCQFGAPVVRGKGCECPNCSVVRETWGHGFVFLGTLTPKSAQYCARYVVKKMTATDDVRLNGRHPEFARMSLKPGIGADALWDAASEIMRYSLEERNVSQIRHGSQKLPLGRYLRRKLQDMTGLDELQRQRINDAALSQVYEQLQLVREVAFATDKAVQEVFREANEGYEKVLQGKLNLAKERRKL